MIADSRVVTDIRWLQNWQLIADDCKLWLTVDCGRLQPPSHHCLQMIAALCHLRLQTIGNYCGLQLLMIVDSEWLLIADNCGPRRTMDSGKLREIAGNCYRLQRIELPSFADVCGLRVTFDCWRLQTADSPLIVCFSFFLFILHPISSPEFREIISVQEIH